MRRFDIYTKNGCGWCEKAKQLMQSKGWNYNEKIIGVNATKDEVQQRVNSLGVSTTITTVPQIFLIGDTGNSTYIGGFDQLNQQASSGQL